MTSRPKVRFGIRLHQSGYSYEDLRSVWVEADRLGFYSATLYDLMNAPALECWTTLSALAAETRQIRLVPLALANLYRHPAVLAKMAATLDVISGGRLELGIGAGGDGGDHLAVGIEFPSTPVRVAMLEEAMQIVKLMWRGEPASFEGDHYRIESAACRPGVVQKPRPPILIGGHGETHLLHAVAAHGDIANMRMDMGLDEHRRKHAALEAHCREVGRDVSEIEVSHNAQVLIAEDAGALEVMVSAQAEARSLTPVEFRETLANAIVGTPAECASQLRRYVEAGITYFFLLFPHPVKLDQLRLFAQEVMPEFTE